MSWTKRRSTRALPGRGSASVSSPPAAGGGSQAIGRQIDANFACGSRHDPARRRVGRRSNFREKLLNLWPFQDLVTLIAALHPCDQGDAGAFVFLLNRVGDSTCLFRRTDKDDSPAIRAQS